MGVEIRRNYLVGKPDDQGSVGEGCRDAIFVGSGAGLPRFLNIPGENYVESSANEYLTR